MWTIFHKMYFLCEGDQVQCGLSTTVKTKMRFGVWSEFQLVEEVEPSISEYFCRCAKGGYCVLHLFQIKICW